MPGGSFMCKSKDLEIEAMVAEAQVQTTHDLLLDPWPENLGLRIEAKIDKALTNHLPHLEARITRLEAIFLSKQRWAFWTGLVTLCLLAYMILGK